ncbi:hypothetical protein [Singulisphaera sp. PoT]|uniref:hypothetical protein n=1 Tax=Singulisphaera sp. PoT TaxID=3411797 RepID=UPI003BF4D35A
MKSVNGQIIRRVGLLLEMICLLGLIASRKQQVPALILGVDSQQLFMIGLLSGFVLWFAGTVAIFRQNRKPEKPPE